MVYYTEIRTYKLHECNSIFSLTSGAIYVCSKFVISTDPRTTSHFNDFASIRGFSSRLYCQNINCTHAIAGYQSIISSPNFYSWFLYRSIWRIEVIHTLNSRDVFHVGSEIIFFILMNSRATNRLVISHVHQVKIII